MAANKKTPYVILYWFSFKIILCILILCGRVSLPDKILPGRRLGDDLEFQHGGRFGI